METKYPCTIVYMFFLKLSLLEYITCNAYNRVSYCLLFSQIQRGMLSYQFWHLRDSHEIGLHAKIEKGSYKYTRSWFFLLPNHYPERKDKMAKHHPDLIFCRKQPGIAIGRLCEKCDGRCVICDRWVICLIK